MCSNHIFTWEFKADFVSAPVLLWNQHEITLTFSHYETVELGFKTSLKSQKYLTFQNS